MWAYIILQTKNQSSRDKQIFLKLFWDVFFFLCTDKQQPFIRITFCKALLIRGYNMSLLSFFFIIIPEISPILSSFWSHQINRFRPKQIIRLFCWYEYTWKLPCEIPFLSNSHLNCSVSGLFLFEGETAICLCPDQTQFSALSDLSLHWFAHSPFIGC